MKDTRKLNSRLKKELRSASVWIGDETFVEVRYPEEVNSATQIIEEEEFQIERSYWNEGSNYEAYYIMLKDK